MRFLVQILFSKNFASVKKMTNIRYVSWLPHLPTFCTCVLVVDGTGAIKDNKEEKTREVADSRMYHTS